MRFFHLAILALFLMSFSYKSYQPNKSLDTHMSPDETDDTGLNKLTPEERKALQEWINKNHYIKPSATPHKDHHPEVSEVLGNGSYIRLSDNSLWHIHPNDRPVTQGWITPANIEVRQNRSGNYPYTLTNTLTGSSVRAQSAKSLPQSLIRTPAQKETKQQRAAENKQLEQELKTAPPPKQKAPARQRPAPQKKPDSRDFYGP